MRLIDADALLEDGIRVKYGWNEDGVLLIPLRDVTKSIKNAPTVDAVPVVHGRWVMTLYTTTSKRGRVIANKKFACSVCGYGNGRKQNNYCPSCGADMRERSEGE